MFITKKNYNKALAKQKEALDLEWEKRWAERDERFWQQEREKDLRNDVERRFSAIEKRVRELEKFVGFEEEKPTCPFEITKVPYC